MFSENLAPLEAFYQFPVFSSFCSGRFLISSLLWRTDSKAFMNESKSSPRGDIASELPVKAA